MGVFDSSHHHTHTQYNVPTDIHFWYQDDGGREEFCHQDESKEGERREKGGNILMFF